MFGIGGVVGDAQNARFGDPCVFGDKGPLGLRGLACEGLGCEGHAKAAGQL